MFSSSGANPNNDLQLPQPPSDGISAVRWAPTGNFLAASSWDKTVRVWEISSQGQAQVKLGKQFDSPLTTCDWSGDGSKLFTAHIDGKVNMMDAATQTVNQVGMHKVGLQAMQFIPELNLLVSGGWDKMLRYWDCRQANPAVTVELPHPVFSLDVKHPLLVLADADKHVAVFNLQNPQQVFKYEKSTLSKQIRCVSAFPQKDGYIITSVEGRCALLYLQPQPGNRQHENFSFRCHRTGSNCYPVNDVTFHQLGTFATGGADGKFNFWDKANRQRLKEFQKMPNSVTSVRFNSTGELFAYGVSYDWSKGSEGVNSSTNNNNIYVHAVQAVEVTPRKK